MIKKIAKGFLILLSLCVIGLVGYICISGKFFAFTAFRHLTADIDDYHIFENHVIHQSTNPKKWEYSNDFKQNIFTREQESFFKEIMTNAIVVVKDGKIVFENYDGGFSDSTISGSFSVAKSVIGILVGIANEEGKLKLDDKIANYIPHFNDNEDLKQVTIRDVLKMASGVKFDEAYASAFSKTTEAYYGTDLTKMINELEMERKPNTICAYKSINTEILGFVLIKATGKSISEYCYEKLWNPLGMEHFALWSMDHKDGIEKTYCCLNATARDYAKIGKLMLDSGKNNGIQILNFEYIKAMTTPNLLIDEDGKITDYYGMHWWIGSHKNNPVYYARGILGQQIIVYPAINSVIVRLGKLRGEKNGHHYEDFDKLCDLAYGFSKK